MVLKCWAEKVFMNPENSFIPSKNLVYNQESPFFVTFFHKLEKHFMQIFTRKVWFKVYSGLRFFQE
jgi:uncharacterized protein (DUF1697 family)